MAAQQGRGDFAAAFQRDVTQVTRVDACRFGDQRRLHPVLATHCAAGANHHTARIFFQCLNEIVEILVGRVFFHSERAVAGAHS